MKMERARIRELQRLRARRALNRLKQAIAEAVTDTRIYKSTVKLVTWLVN